LYYCMLAIPPDSTNMFLNHIRRMIEIICAQSMLYRLFNDPILLIPHTGKVVK
jgi:hypothetical protein